MKSGISFFNAGFFKNNVKRFWPLWAAYFAVLFVTMPLMNMLSGGAAENLFSLLRGLCGATCTIAAFIMAILTAMATFSFMYNTRSVGMISSMPVRREAVFTSAFLSGLLPVLAVNVIIAVITFLSSGTAYKALEAQWILTWLGVWSLQFFIFYGIAVITAMTTGMLIALPVLYGIFNFLIPGIEMLMRWVLQIFTFGMVDASAPFTEFASPAAFILGHCADMPMEPPYDHLGRFVAQPLPYLYWGKLLIYAAVALVLAVIALLMFRRREIERTGDVVAVKRLRPVFKYGVTVCSALGLGLLFYAIFADFGPYSHSSALLMALTMLFGTLVGYFVSDMLLKKSFHVFRGNWRGFAVMAVLSVVFVIGCDVDVLGIERYVPDAKNVESITITNGWHEYNAYTVTEDFDAVLDLHRAIVANRKEYESDREFMNSTEELVRLSYTLKSGRVVSRCYYLSYDAEKGDPVITDFLDLINSTEAVLQRYTPDIQVTPEHVVYATAMWDDWTGKDGEGIHNECSLTPEMMVELYYEAVIPDIRNGGYRTDRELADLVDVNIYFELCEDYQKDPYVTEALQIRVDPNEPLTIQWLRDNLGWDVYPDKK